MQFLHCPACDGVMEVQSESPNLVARCTSCGRVFNLGEEPPAPPELAETDKFADIDVPDIARRWVKVIDRKASPRPSRATEISGWCFTALCLIGFFLALPVCLEGNWDEGITRMLVIVGLGSCVMVTIDCIVKPSYEPLPEPTVAEEIERLMAEDPSLAHTMKGVGSDSSDLGGTSMRADAIRAEINPAQSSESEVDERVRIQRRDQLSSEEPGSS
jgi:hypothetical protein